MPADSKPRNEIVKPVGKIHPKQRGEINNLRAENLYLHGEACFKAKNYKEAKQALRRLFLSPDERIAIENLLRTERSQPLFNTNLFNNLNDIFVFNAETEWGDLTTDLVVVSVKDQNGKAKDKTNEQIAFEHFIQACLYLNDFAMIIKYCDSNSPTRYSKNAGLWHILGYAYEHSNPPNYPEALNAYKNAQKNDRRNSFRYKTIAAFLAKKAEFEKKDKDEEYWIYFGMGNLSFITAKETDKFDLDLHNFLYPPATAAAAAAPAVKKEKPDHKSRVPAAASASGSGSGAAAAGAVKVKKEKYRPGHMYSNFGRDAQESLTPPAQMPPPAESPTPPPHTPSPSSASPPHSVYATALVSDKQKQADKKHAGKRKHEDQDKAKPRYKLTLSPPPVIAAGGGGSDQTVATAKAQQPLKPIAGATASSGKMSRRDSAVSQRYKLAVKTAAATPTSTQAPTTAQEPLRKKLKLNAAAAGGGTTPAALVAKARTDSFGKPTAPIDLTRSQSTASQESGAAAAASTDKRYSIGKTHPQFSLNKSKPPAINVTATNAKKPVHENTGNTPTQPSPILYLSSEDEGEQVVPETPQHKMGKVDVKAPKLR